MIGVRVSPCTERSPDRVIERIKVAQRGLATAASCLLYLLVTHRQNRSYNTKGKSTECAEMVGEGLDKKNVNLLRKTEQHGVHTHTDRIKK